MSRLGQTPAGLRRRLAEERGMTIVEAVVAALVLVIAALGVFQVVDASTRNTYRAEQSQVVVNRLQAELEAIRQYTYAQVALTEQPAHDPDPANPNWRVSEGEFALRRDGDDRAPLVYQGSPLENGGEVGVPVPAEIEPGPEPFQSGDVSGQIYRYVVWIDDEACGEYCPGAQDLKRVVVVAALDPTASGGRRAYHELQSDIVDPRVTPEDTGGGGGPDEDDEQTIPATFWLTDTSCGDPDERAPIVEDPPGSGGHPTHNTLGVCADGMRTGGTPGAPDLMFNEQPPELPDVEEQPVFDYSSNVGSGDGLRMVPPSLNGCLLPDDLLNLPGLPGLPGGEGAVHTKVHRWLSPPMEPGETLVLSGSATLELSAKTVDGVPPHQGRICVWLFKRHLDVGGLPIDTFAVNLDPPLTNLSYFHGEPDPPSADWPEDWTEISVSMTFAALDPIELDFTDLEVFPGERLGLAIAVEREGSAAQALDFMYDHPNFPSRLEVRARPTLGE